MKARMSGKAMLTAKQKNYLNNYRIKLLNLK